MIEVAVIQYARMGIVFVVLALVLFGCLDGWTPS